MCSTNVIFILQKYNDKLQHFVFLAELEKYYGFQNNPLMELTECKRKNL